RDVPLPSRRSSDLIEQLFEGTRLLYVVEVFPLKVLEDGDLKGLAIRKFSDHCGNRRQTGTLRCPEAALACDYLVATLNRSDDYRLQHAALGDRGRKFRDGGVIEPLPRLQR